MVKVKKHQPEPRKFRIRIIPFLIIADCIVAAAIFAGLLLFEKNFTGRIYPGVRIDGISFGGRTPQDIENYYNEKSKPLGKIHIQLSFEENIATVSGQELTAKFDNHLSAIQAYSVGRTGNFLSDTYQKWRAATVGLNLTSVLTMNEDMIGTMINNLATSINIPADDGLFQFENGKVVAFKPSKNGRKLNTDQTRERIQSFVTTVARADEPVNPNITMDLPVETIHPSVTTENSNSYGIRELLGVGTSTYFHSIPGRIHNVALASERVHGHLVPPGSVFSFNDALGDVSAATGFAPAYIIKDGKTVLGDGGGVCQVSTTLFRAVLNAGLPIVERHAHAYRVGYCEQDSPPGIDATVFGPTVDLKFKNNTPGYLLIQMKNDPQNLALRFEIYGTSDGRKSDVTKPVILGQSSPPPTVYQDDPTLPAGVLKQVDFSAWGANITFNYKVTRNGETLIDEKYVSNYRPWAAVYLKGTRT
jgi:vancomycin resistance protein YoaR